jgi:hypothetical protein
MNLVIEFPGARSGIPACFEFEVFEKDENDRELKIAQSGKSRNYHKI